MKRSIPSLALVILAGILIVGLAVIMARFFHPLMSFVSGMMMKAGKGNSQVLLYAGVALIPVIAGTLMGLVIVFVVKREDREYEEALKAAWDISGPLYEDFDRCLDSINASILRLQDTSRTMRHQTEELNNLGRRMGNKSSPPAVETEVAVAAPETCSATLANNVVEDVRILHPANALIPQELFPSPESRQKIWFFPHR
jgi:hypothetical protein